MNCSNRKSGFYGINKCANFAASEVIGVTPWSRRSDLNRRDLDADRTFVALFERALSYHSTNRFPEPVVSHSTRSPELYAACAEAIRVPTINRITAAIAGNINFRFLVDLVNIFIYLPPKY